MSKRAAQFERRERDFYPTPPSAVVPLLAHLPARTRFCEPCAGNGALIDLLTAAGHVCARAWDIEPQRADIDRYDARTRQIGNIDCFITNPPWARGVLHDLIIHLSDQHPTWLLFDADWKHTRQSVPYLSRLRKIVSVGRVKWMPGSPYVGKDNACWYLFQCPGNGVAEFHGRATNFMEAA